MIKIEINVDNIFNVDRLKLSDSFEPESLLLFRL